MKDLAILGTGGFAREVATLIKAINDKSPSYNFLGFVDDKLEKGTIINGYPVIGNDEEINFTNKQISLVLAFGDPNLKKQVVSKFTNPLIDFPTIVHPTALIADDNISIGRGNIICAGCIVTTNIILHNFITLNLMCTVGHDTEINDFSSFMPSVNISGEVVIEEGVYVGTGAKIINQLRIGNHTIVGAGAVVVKTLPAYCTAVGVPAKLIKVHNE